MPRERAEARVPRWGRGPRGLLIVAAASLLAVGCAGASTSSTGSTVAPPAVVAPSPSVATAPPTAAATVPTSLPAPESTAAPAIDPAVALAAAFESLAAGYHFDTVAAVGDQEVASASGDRVGDGTRLSIVSNGAAVDYVITPAGAWVSVDAQWDELDQPPITDPVTPLRSPSSLAVESQDGSVATLIGMYPPIALSLTGDAPVAVRFVIDGTELQQISYQVDTPQGPAQVIATISALVDTTPVTGPPV